MNIHETFLRFFPVPQYVAMPAVGIDLSDSSAKYIKLEKTARGMRVKEYGERDIPTGAIVSGTVRDRGTVVDVLKDLKKEYGFHFVRAGLPEEKAYLFMTNIPHGSPLEVRSALELHLEENVPLSPQEAVYDYDILPGGHGRGVVSVFPQEGVNEYTAAFQDAGLVPLSFEIEAQAVARAVFSHTDRGTHMLLDMGRSRSGISIVSGGIVQYTSTIDIGGDDITQVIKHHKPDIQNKDIVEIKNTKGCLPQHDVPEMSVDIIKIIARLTSELDRHRSYWKTHTAGSEEALHIADITLCGGSANLQGLPEKLNQSLKLPVVRANVWTNTFALDDYIPPIAFRESLGYASAIGLALNTTI